VRGYGAPARELKHGTAGAAGPVRAAVLADGQALPQDALIDALWAGEPPPGAWT